MDLQPMRRSDTGREREDVLAVVRLHHDLSVAVARYSARQDGTHYTETRVHAFDGDGNVSGLLATVIGDADLDPAILTTAIATARLLYPDQTTEA
jgi:hypothetical protein